MTWRGSTTIRDRIFASLPYLLPLMDALVIALVFGASLFNVFPALQLVFLPLFPLLFIYNSFGGFTSLIIFFALFLLVVRNERINHFIRFNTMQALLLDITLVLARLILRVLQVGGLAFALKVIANAIFLGVLVAVIYSVVQSLRGRYAEIPTLSDAVYMQVR